MFRVVIIHQHNIWPAWPAVAAGRPNNNSYRYFFRSKVHEERQCAELDGYYNSSDKFCYHNGSQDVINCGYFVNRKCYAYADSSYTASTCANIGGYFTTSSQSGKPGNFCYYRQFNCTFHSTNNQRYRFKTLANNRSECDTNNGYYEHGYCYHDCPDTKYLINDQCYDTPSTQYTQSDCQVVGGVYVHSYCYMDNCNYLLVNSHCYRYKTTSYSNGTCQNIGGYYTLETLPPYHFYCYYTSFNCRYPAADGQCYSRSSNHSQTACKTIPDGYFDVSNNTCYYYCTEMPKLRQCFVADDPSFTRETCALIGGIYSDHTCYYITSYCPLYSASNGQCYTNRSSDLTCNTCQNIGGHYENGYCYYYQDECSGYIIEGQCYSNRSSTYLANSCVNMGGFFRDGYCYYEASKCRNANYRNCTCYPYHTTSKTAATCANIGGYFDFQMQQCFYNSTTCPYYSKNSQCYRYRSSDLSLKTCTSVKGYFAHERDELLLYVYVCYFDKFYYNCSDIPNLGECIIADNPLFTRETCNIIGGIYSNHTCYYTMLQCLLYNTSNGECYSNRSANLTCNTCENIGGHYENGYCYYYQNNCSTYSIGGQCYSNRSSRYSTSTHSCNSIAGFYRNGYCYYEGSRCSSAYYNNCTCFRYSDASKTPSTCKNFGGYYDLSLHRCFYNLSTCPYYNKNSQCYKHRNGNFSSNTCSLINGYRLHESDSFGRYRYVCYYNEINCSKWANDQCYSHFSSTYNEGTCVSTGGYYSQKDQGCYYNSFTCTYQWGSQCYDKYSSVWTKMQCDEAHGYYYSYYGRCYTSNYYCPFVHNSLKRCYFYTSQSYECSSCKLLGGFLYSGTCYYNTENCTKPLFLANNGQCYENQTTVTTAADCIAASGDTFYNESDNLCYFSSGTCLSGQFYANCTCYIHRSTVYTAESCKIFRGYYYNERCYYNSSLCPSNYHSINGQCYQLSRSLTLPTCLNIGGHYDDPSTSGTSATCYYNSFNCSGFIVDGRHCYMNRSATFNRVTCRNIGGIYGYRYSDRQYRSAGSYLSSGRAYYCLYNTFSCSG